MSSPDTLCFSGSLLPVIPSSRWRLLSLLWPSSGASPASPFSWSPSSACFSTSDNAISLSPDEITSITSAESNHLLLSAYPLTDGQRLLRQYQLCMDDSSQLGVLKCALHDWLRLHSAIPPHTPLGQPLRILVLLNPFSGQRRAAELWEREVEPLWRKAGIFYETRTTESPGHAEKIAAGLDLDGWSALALGGGDGIVAEAINGLFSREDRARALQLPIVHLPMGTGNALAASIAYNANEPFSPRGTFCREIALMAVRPEYRRLKLYRAEFQGEQPTRMMFLSLSWGLMADIDICSERFRCIGMARLHLEAFLRIARLPSVARYRARISYLPMPDGPRLRDMMRKLRFGIDQSREEFGEGHFDEQVDEEEEREWTRMVMDSENVPPIDRPVPTNWRNIDDEFCFVSLSTISHIGSDLPYLPSARLHSTPMFLSFVRWSALYSRVHMARILLNINSCAHLSDPAVEIIPVLACRVQPGESAGGMVALDGEAVREPGDAFQVSSSIWNAIVASRRNQREN